MKIVKAHLRQDEQAELEIRRYCYTIISRLCGGERKMLQMFRATEMFDEFDKIIEHLVDFARDNGVGGVKESEGCNALILEFASTLKKRAKIKM